MPTRKKSTSQLKIVFDTNIIHTEIAHELLGDGVRRFIEEYSTYPDLSIQWYLPNIAVGERRYQMQQKSLKFIPQIEKLNHFLGKNLKITDKILKQRVDTVIDHQISKTGILELTLDINSIDWESIINRAIFRLPPFEIGKKEKGFKDSLIAESFLQFVKESPSTLKKCRLIFVSNDRLLRDFLKECTRLNKNVDILKDINELRSLLNALISKVKKEFLASIMDKIMDFFFNKEDDNNLFVKNKIQEKIIQKHSMELESVPKNHLKRENSTWWISQPVFITKEKDRTHWVNVISVDAKLFKIRELEPIHTSLFATHTQSSIMDSLMKGPSRIEVGKGRTKFDVSWSVRITSKKKLIKDPIIDNIQFVSTEWDEDE